jgi:hypothetical protein
MSRTKLTLSQRHTGTVFKGIQADNRADNVPAATYLFHGLFWFKGQSDVTDGAFCVTRDSTDAPCMAFLPIA